MNLETRPRNIVICSDGTGNSGGKARGTNVWAIFRGLKRLHVPADGGPAIEQIAIYDDGVGTQSFLPMRLLTGAFGVGVNQNVRQLYTELVRVYRPGDHIFLFGFSRGAYTVRTLAGLICLHGVLDRTQYAMSADLDSAVRRLYKHFQSENLSRLPSWLVHDRSRTSTMGGSGDDSRLDELRFAELDREKAVRFLGVWDTVGALGGPFPLFATFVNLFVGIRFHDYCLHPAVVRARQALAIDDERKTFHPLIWKESCPSDDGKASAPGDAPDVKQVWFAGVHSNVGGGYPKDQIAYVALDWMIGEAQVEDRSAARLYFNQSFIKEIRGEADARGHLYDSRAGVWAFYRFSPRRIARLWKSKTPILVHASVFKRIQASTRDYAPGHLPLNFKLVSSETESREFVAIQDAIDGSREERGRRAAQITAIDWQRQCLYYAFVVAWLLLGAGITYVNMVTPDADIQARAAEHLPSVLNAAQAVLPSFAVPLLKPLLFYALAYPVSFSVAGTLIVALFGFKTLLHVRSRRARLDAWSKFRHILARNGRLRQDGVAGRDSKAESTQEESRETI